MKVAILTVSDGCYHKKREDTSSKKLAAVLTEKNWTIICNYIVPDEIIPIQAQVRQLTENKNIDLIITTGGTGLGPRDVTPDAVQPLLEIQVPGLSELMRLRGLEQTEFAALSRSVAGVRKRTLILTLPGSPKGATESLKAILSLLPHAIDLIQGRTAH